MFGDAILHRSQIGRVSVTAAIVAAAVAAGTSSVAGAVFTNATMAAGINHVAHWGGTYPPQFVPSPIQEQAGGAAAGDFDGDGWVDLYVTRFWDSDILYRNNRDGTFSDVTATAFLGGVGVHQSNGAAWGDVDNDGDLDLAVATLNESRHLLYINNGLGQFAEEGGSRGVLIATGLPNTAGTSFAMGDYDDDGYLDMYVTEWRSFTAISSPAQARLFRNLGAAAPGHFADVTTAAGVAMDRQDKHIGKSFSFTPRFSDLDRDGLTDIAVVSDEGTSRLFWNNGNGTFINRTAAAGIDTGTNDMGFTLADFNGDGLLDWFVTSIGTGSGMHPSGNRLFLNNGNRTFTDATDAAGVREGGWGWGVDAIDYDNNGLLDIIHVNGYGFSTAQPSVFFENIGSRTNPQYVNLAHLRGITDLEYGRGLLTFDYDRDGDLDVFIMNYSTSPILYRNDGGNAGDWLQVKTVGSSSNRDGIGAYITITPDLANPDLFYVAEIDGSSAYVAQSEIVAHFGLGQVDMIDRIDVEWPSGYTQQFTNVAPNQRITITEGLLADFDGSDQVDGVDLASWSVNLGMTGAGGQQGDADRDGDVDGGDFLVWQRQLGRSVDSGLSLESVAAVPEPMGSLLLAFGGAVLAHAGRGSRRSP